MSEFGSLLQFVNKNDNTEQILENIEDEKNNIIEDKVKEVNLEFNERMKPFDTAIFANELKEISENKNKIYSEVSNNINGYSISQDCIMCTVKKILNYPVRSFAHKWLPILMRSTIGTAIHDLIQDNTSQFTETEVSMKIPSIRFSGRLDALIGNNVIVEIKSCTYTDYSKILKNMKPRLADFYQVMVYKYILENYLEEAKNPGVKTRTGPPKLDAYNIDTIQFIYIAHDICASDVEDFGEAISVQKSVKKQLNSRRNPFFFMSSVVLDTNSFDETPYMTWIKNKIDAINYYVDNNKLPDPNDPFIDRKKCYFCLYNTGCEVKDI